MLNVPSLRAGGPYRGFLRRMSQAASTARQRVRKRDVSLAARTREGVAAWDTFQTLVETAKKLGVNITAYLRDRITRAYAQPSLASLVVPQPERAAQPRAA